MSVENLKITSTNHLICRYWFPFHIFYTGLAWNFEILVSPEKHTSVSLTVGTNYHMRRRTGNNFVMFGQCVQ